MKQSGVKNLEGEGDLWSMRKTALNKLQKLSLYLNILFRHAGLDPVFRDLRKDWIPAFAGMTVLNETTIKIQTLNNSESWAALEVFRNNCTASSLHSE
jgi:hypothetical protein